MIFSNVVFLAVTQLVTAAFWLHDGVVLLLLLLLEDYHLSDTLCYIGIVAVNHI